MKYILEIYHRGDCIEHRECKEQFIAPAVGERIYVEFENPHYSEEYGHWWIVRERKHLAFAATLNMQTLMLFCEPDPKKGESLFFNSGRNVTIRWTRAAVAPLAANPVRRSLL